MSLIDRKLLVESMLSEATRVDFHEYDEKYPEYGEGVSLDYHLHINPEIIKRFIEEGRLKRLNQDSTYDKSASYA